MNSAALSFGVDQRTGDQIRFMTAGSVDDGKSTLIGRLLLDTGALMRDQADAVDAEDLAALTDGLEAERAQGITIDIAYRYFAMPDVSYIIADAPGHEQYTRNMVTAASVSEVAVVVIDASRIENGQLKPQTRRHATIAALMGLDVIAAVNKMDAVDWSHGRFEEVRAAFAVLAQDLGLGEVACVPVSALRGDNVARRGGASWWAGPTLLDLIKRHRRSHRERAGALRLPVQTVLRDGGERYYAGRIESGELAPGDTVVIGPQRAGATITQVRVNGRAAPVAVAGDSVSVQLDRERDTARGDVIAADEVRYTRRIVADLCWLDENAWVRGRRYVLRQAALETQALIDEIRFVRGIEDGSMLQSEALELNAIASVQLSARDPILADIYNAMPGTGAFVLFDPQTNQTCAAGMIREAL